MDAVERIITHAVQKSKDGRIDVTDFLNEAAASMRYVTFTPMEVSEVDLRLGEKSDFRPISFGISPRVVEWARAND